MVHNVIAAFAQRIDALDVDGAGDQGEGQGQARRRSRSGVGYPDTWRDYAALEVVRGDALGNAERAELFEYRAQPRPSSGSRSIAASG